MTVPMAEDNLLSIDEAAERLGVHSRTLRRYIKDGKILPLRLSAQVVRIKVGDVEEFMRENLKISTGTGVTYVPRPQEFSVPG